MSTAFLISSRSSCSRLNVGCILVSSGENPNRVIAAGYNGHLPGIPHIQRIREGREQSTVHAEQNAVADAARRGVSIGGSHAYITHFPCVNCAKVLAASGVTNVNYHLDYHNDDLVYELLGESNITLDQL